MGIPRLKHYSGDNPCRDCDLYILCQDFVVKKDFLEKVKDDPEYSQYVLQKRYEYNNLDEYTKALIDMASDCRKAYPNFQIRIPESISLYTRSGSHIATFDSFGSMLRAWGVVAIIGLIIALLCR